MPVCRMQELSKRARNGISVRQGFKLETLSLLRIHKLKALLSVLFVCIFIMATPIPGTLALAYKARQLVNVNKPARLYRVMCK